MNVFKCFNQRNEDLNLCGREPDSISQSMLNAGEWGMGCNLVKSLKKRVLPQ